MRVSRSNKVSRSCDDTCKCFKFAVELRVIDDVAVKAPISTTVPCCGILKCAGDERGRRIEHSISPALRCRRPPLMHHAGIDGAQCPGRHDQGGRTPRAKLLSAGLDHANCESLMDVWRKDEIAIIGEQEFRRPRTLRRSTSWTDCHLVPTASFSATDGRSLSRRVDSDDVVLHRLRSADGKSCRVQRQRHVSRTTTSRPLIPRCEPAIARAIGLTRHKVRIRQDGRAADADMAGV